MMAVRCELCGSGQLHISSFLGLCPACARKPESREIAEKAHEKSLAAFSLGYAHGSEARCTQCVNECQLDDGEKGFCGMRANSKGRVGPVFGDDAIVDWYYDPVPTNCVAEWTCPATLEHAAGKKNLSVFFYGCSFDCLFCQNWHHREGSSACRPKRSPGQLLKAVDRDTYCVCFFGGDPTPQLQYAFCFCESLVENKGDAVRICWETNGSMSSGLAARMADFSTRTGGTVKFDLKAFDENLHFVLCGTSNKQALHNFATIAKKMRENGKGQLVASTLLVPGYVDSDEVCRIAGFIAQLDQAIPYSLLAFHPDYLMRDLPITTGAHALEALAAAGRAGLTNVHLGNMHLLR